jgi:hypothetical protein
MRRLPGEQHEEGKGKDKGKQVKGRFRASDPQANNSVDAMHDFRMNEGRDQARRKAIKCDTHISIARARDTSPPADTRKIQSIGDVDDRTAP